VRRPSKSIYLVMVSKLATSITPKEMKSLIHVASKLKKRQIERERERGGGDPLTHGEAIRALQQESNARFHDRPMRSKYITAERLREI
jgi:hypothetical protein